MQEWLQDLFAFACGEGNGWVIAHPEPGGECRLEVKSLRTGLTVSYTLTESQAVALGDDVFVAEYTAVDEENEEYPAYRKGSWKYMLELIELEPYLRPEKGQIHLSYPNDPDSYVL